MKCEKWHAGTVLFEKTGSSVCHFLIMQEISSKLVRAI